MNRRLTGEALAIATVAATALAVAFTLHCSLMTNFDKPLLIPDGSVVICSDDESCWDVSRPMDDCDVCDQVSHECVPDPDATDVDDDGWYVCERAVGLGTADCDDGKASVFPGNPELSPPDLLDNNCNGIIDEGLLAASDSPPTRISKPTTCAEPCLWSNPVARYEAATDRIAVIWESDESDAGPVENMVRVASFNVSGTSLLGDQYLIYAGAGEEHNLMEPWITGTISPAPSLAAVWVDLLGGRLLGVHGFDMCADDLPVCIRRPAPTWPTVAEEAAVRAVMSEPAEPVIASRSDDAQIVISWTGVPSGSTAGDVFVARFEHSGSWVHDTSIGTGGILDVSQSPADDETGRPALAMAGTGLVVAWVSPGQDEIRLVYRAGPGLEPAPSGIVSLSPPGIGGGMRDPVLVASDARPDTTLVYLLYCANPEGQSTAEVWAMSVDLDILNTVASDYSDAFGAPLEVSDSPDAVSIDVAASWTSASTLDAIGVAWNDRRGGLNHVYFRRIAALESNRETSGVLASEEIDLSDDGGPSGVYGQGPTVVGWESVHQYAVVWWQRRNELDVDTGDLYMRLVEPTD